MGLARIPSIGQKSKLLHLVIFIGLLLLAVAGPAQANCADTIASVELVQPGMERLWQQLQKQTQYPWGKARPFGILGKGRVTLTPAFNRLNGDQKRQVLAMLHVGSGYHELLTPQERKAAGEYPGALSPFRVYDSDGRILALPYDGCTMMFALTEYERYQIAKSRGSSEGLGLSATEEIVEKKMRSQFFKVISWDKAQAGYWIAWVPQTKYFEINVPGHYDQAALNRFWKVASRGYRYVVLSTDGTALFERPRTAAPPPPPRVAAAKPELVIGGSGWNIDSLLFSPDGRRLVLLAHDRGSLWDR